MFHRLTRFSAMAASVLLLPGILSGASAQDILKPGDCLSQAIQEIRSRPELKYLATLDGQNVLLEEFYEKCAGNWPMCCLYTKFYYWKNKVMEIVSMSSRGPVEHKIRIYHNCLSTCFPERSDSKKTHGDVAEFYDEDGVFMGLAVYMGDGRYCSLPYDGYRKSN